MKFDIRIHGNVPQQLEIEAANKDEAENEALNEIFSGLEIVVEPQTQKPFLVRGRDAIND
jgi:hypothetical protein